MSSQNREIPIRDELVNLFNQMANTYNQASEYTQVAGDNMEQLYSLINQNAPLEEQRLQVIDVVRSAYYAQYSFLKVNALALRMANLLGHQYVAFLAPPNYEQ